MLVLLFSLVAVPPASASAGTAGTGRVAVADVAPAKAPPARGRGTRTVGLLIVGDWGCTATVVASRSRSVVATAAHCVYSAGRYGNLRTARFAPGYRDHTAPEGVWRVDGAWVPRGWRTGTGARPDDDGLRDVDPTHDVAFLRISPDRDGRRIQDVVGAEGIAFESPLQRDVTVLGYPAEAPYDGETLRTCSGRTDVLEDGTSGVGCDFTPGASGGPWLTGPGARSGNGFVTGVTSAAITGGPAANVESHFGEEAHRLYDLADSAT
ncbi:trypsin-like serine peptidase [Pseudonocardia phyllosphaerae]|uniref:trypsin-like serine peptidase n=1 Tax=Pseudonocardia phyllosphaerae TaxID=3390502 RepID=UPI00397A06C7